MKYYAVRAGRTPGIYTTWPSCETQVKGFPGAVYQAFSSKEHAEAFMAGTPLPSPATSPTQSPIPSPLAGADQCEGVNASHQPFTASPAPDTVHIWVDGACLPHGDKPMQFGWAYLILDGQRELHRASGHDVPAEARRHRNVAGEIQAVLHALAWCRDHGIATATIYVDYQGLASWVQGTWKTNTPFTQSYVERVRAFGMNLTWQKVRAHSGDPYNDIVDHLAGDAARFSLVNSKTIEKSPRVNDPSY